ncbi:MAG: beta-N-acetylhexosaminidase [Microbacteriaceae bacterium]|nr:beta-N-acetylhexosaminidase [Microbacteriaceae bacterium]
MAFIHRMGWYGTLAIILAGAATVSTSTVAGVPSTPHGENVTMRSVIPVPVERINLEGSYRFNADSAISATGEARPVGEYLASILRGQTGELLPFNNLGNIVLVVEPGHPENGYSLSINSSRIWIAANDAAGLFLGVQTLRQLLPPPNPNTHNWAVAATDITDSPRFSYRGAMLDVARHFFGVEDVKRYIDEIAMLKLNVLHLHLSDDQGWRLEINGWPRLTEIGGASEVGGGTGGYYTQAQYSEIVNYAASRYITIVPEFDMPGHTNAALSSYAELNCNNRATRPYHGYGVGFSSLCVHKEVTYQFIADVVNQVAALTPGPYFHLGGDESSATSLDDYKYFVDRVARIITDAGKLPMGWHDIGYAPNLPKGTVGEYWDYTTPRGASASLTEWILDAGGKLVMAPSNVAYVDQKYSSSESIGTNWAQPPLTLEESYGWDPASVFPSYPEQSVLGVEAPLWTETVKTMADIEYMAFPRIAAIAEIGWSKLDPSRNFEEFVIRLATFGIYMESAGINFKRTPEVPWQ